MHDEVALVQIEERVDGTAQAMPRGTHRDIFPAEQFGTADEHQFFGHQPEATGEMAAGEVQPASAGGGALGKQFPQTFFLGRGGGHHPHFLIAADRLQFIPHPVEHPGEPLHAFDRQRGGGLQARLGDRGKRDGWKTIDPLEDILRIGKTGRPPEAFKGSPCLLDKLPRLHQRPPGGCRDEVGKLHASGGGGRSRGRRLFPALGRRKGLFHGGWRAGGKGRQIDRLQRGDAALGDGVERAQRFDLIAEKFHPHRPVPVGGKQIDDAAATGKVAR